MNEKSKERLKEYLEVDTIYQNYKKGIEEEKSDFDLFCVQHCLDIENLLNEVEELHNKIDKAINLVNNEIYKNRCECSYCNSYYLKEMKNILKDNE